MQKFAVWEEKHLSPLVKELAGMAKSDPQYDWHFLYKLEEKGYHNAPKVIVAGGRDFDDYKMMRQKLFELFNNNKFFVGNIVKIISGMADGADTLAIKYADENHLPKIMMPACWYYDRHRAGFLRNEDMLSIADALAAFWGGESHGTKHMIEISQEKGIPVWVFNYKNNKSEQK